MNILLVIDTIILKREFTFYMKLKSLIVDCYKNQHEIKLSYLKDRELISIGINSRVNVTANKLSSHKHACYYD